MNTTRSTNMYTRWGLYFCFSRLMLRRGFPVLSIGLLFLFSMPYANAFKLVPMKMTLKPEGRGANGVFTVINDGDETLAVTVRMMSRVVDVDGKESNESVASQFMVFPPQFALKASGSQTVRVRWIGKKTVTKEMAFRLVAEQLPVKLDKGENNGIELNVAFRYLAAIYVRPRGVEPAVSLDLADAALASGPGIELMFENSGSSHVFLDGLSVTLSCQGKDVVLSGPVTEEIAGANLLAGARRRFRIPWPESLPMGSPTASFTYKR